MAKNEHVEMAWQIFPSHGAFGIFHPWGSRGPGVVLGKFLFGDFSTELWCKAVFLKVLLAGDSSQSS